MSSFVEVDKWGMEAWVELVCSKVVGFYRSNVKGFGGLIGNKV